MVPDKSQYKLGGWQLNEFSKEMELARGGSVTRWTFQGLPYPPILGDTSGLDDMVDSLGSV